MDRAVAVGIDLGTTCSRVGVWDNGAVEIIANAQGNRSTLSSVTFTDAGRLIGDAPRGHALRNPENAVFGVKRLMGRKFSDLAVQSDGKRWPFRVIPGERDAPMIVVRLQGEEWAFHPQEISAMVLFKMKEIAEARLMRKVVDTVVTVPAHFDDSQRQATIDAGTIAGLNVLRLVSEPAAAAIAHGLARRGNGQRNVLICDMGGGTTDVSLVTIEDGIVEMRASVGDGHLGGETLDSRLIDYCMLDFKRKTRVDITGNLRALRRLRAQCQQAKCTLSTHFRAIIDIDSLAGGLDYCLNIGRARFEELSMDYFRRCMGLVEECLRSSGIDKGQVHDIVLEGGSSRVPKVQHMLQDFFRGTDAELCTPINPGESVAFGAAVQAAILVSGGSSQVPRVSLREVTPLPVGLEALDGTVSTLVGWNTTVTAKMARGMFEFGRFRLQVPRSVGQAELTVHVDANGIVNVSARDSLTGANIAVTDTGLRLSEAEIERMLRDAQEWHRRDAKRGLEAYCNAILGKLNEDGLQDAFESGEKERIHLAVQDTLEWLDRHPQAQACDFKAEQKELELLVDLSW